MAELVALRQPGAWNLDNAIRTSHFYHTLVVHVGLRLATKSTWRGKSKRVS